MNSDEKMELKRIKASLDETFELLKLIRENSTHSQKTDLTQNETNHHHKKGVVKPMSDEQHETIEQPNTQEYLQKEISELKSIFLSMQQDLNDIKQLLVEQNQSTSNQTNKAKVDTNKSKPASPSYNQLQNLVKTAKPVQMSKKKQQINIK